MRCDGARPHRWHKPFARRSGAPPETLAVHLVADFGILVAHVDILPAKIGTHAEGAPPPRRRRDFPRARRSAASRSGRIMTLQQLNARVGEEGGAKFWFYALRNCFITVADRELMLPTSLTKRLVNHARPQDVRSRTASANELARLGRALNARESEWPEAVAATRLLALTGCRRSEVLNLRWRDIGADTINLRESKTGPRTSPLGVAGRQHIDALPGKRKPEAFLFPRYAEGRGVYNLESCWRAVCADARLGRLRLHDLRHTAASQAIMSGENLPLVGKLLGHRRHRTTAGYAHLADAHLVEAAERVENIIAQAMAT